MKVLKVVDDDNQPTPEQYVIISLDEYERAKRTAITPPKINLKQAGKMIGKETTWIVRNVLDVPKYRRELDVKHGGCVVYGKQGRGYEIEPLKFSDFFRRNFADIYNGAVPINKEAKK